MVYKPSFSQFCSQGIILYGPVVLFLILVPILLPLPVLAAPPQSQGAHVHGIGSLNVALDTDTLYVELKSPAANLIGFEHAPRDEREEHVAHEAIETLEDGKKLFMPSPKAGCILRESVVDHSLQHESHEHSDHVESGQHGPENPDNGHDGHHGPEHEEDGETAHDGHSEIEATYTFSCSRAVQLKLLEVKLFEVFPGFDRIELQLLSPNGQSGATLTPKNNRVTF